MNTIKEIKNELLNDSYYEISHSSGVKIIVYPKENYSSSYAIFGTKYGSIDTAFKTEDMDDFVRVPEGIAHYLEHKLFESEELDAFQRYAETGASANAFTSFDKTCYLFSCSKNFYKSLRILLDFVSNPYFTPETVQKEQGIIGQEIKMYEDDPNWESLFRLLGAMYHNHPVKIDIAGTVESISHITAELLYKCYEIFYNPSNMVLCVTGNVELEKVLEVADEMLKPRNNKEILREFKKEPPTVVKDTVIRNLPVATPIFAIGFKEDIKTPERTLKEIIESETLLEIIAGKTSHLYEELLNDGLINTTFETEFFEGYGFSAHIFSGESTNCEEVRKRINKEINRLKAEGIDKEDFRRVKNKQYGLAIMGFNDIVSVGNSMVSYEFNGESIFDPLEILENITIEDINKRLLSLNVENSSMSIIKQG